MSLMKKILAAAAAVAVVFTISGCADVKNATTIDGYTVRSGIYLYYEANSVGEAQSKVSAAKVEAGETSEVKDVFTETIDGGSTIDWVKTQTMDKLKRFVAIEKLFEANGLSLSDETTSSLNEELTSTWEDDNWYLQYTGSEFTKLGQMYESMGIGKTSYKDILINSAKESEVFLKYYGEGGLEEVADADVNSYLTDNNARVKYIEIPKEDIYGAPYKEGSEREAYIKELVDGYMTRLNDGEAFNQISAEYVKLGKEEDAFVKAEEAAADEKLNETTESDAEEAPEEITLEVLEDSALEKVITKSATTPPADVVSFIFEAALNTPLMYENNDSFFIIVRSDVLSNTEWAVANKSAALHALKDEDFEELLKTTYADYSVVNNDAAISKYSPEKIKLA